MENIVRNHHGKLADFKTINDSRNNEQLKIINYIFKITNINGEQIREDLKKEFFGNNFEWPSRSLSLLIFSACSQ